MTIKLFKIALFSIGDADALLYTLYQNKQTNNNFSRLHREIKYNLHLIHSIPSVILLRAPVDQMSQH